MKAKNDLGIYSNQDSPVEPLNVTDFWLLAESGAIRLGQRLEELLDDAGLLLPNDSPRLPFAPSEVI